MNDGHSNEVVAVGLVGGLAGIGHFMHMIEPILADVSYVAAIVLAVVTIIQKIRHK